MLGTEMKTMRKDGGGKSFRKFTYKKTNNAQGITYKNLDLKPLSTIVIFSEYTIAFSVKIILHDTLKTTNYNA